MAVEKSKDGSYRRGEVVAGRYRIKALLGRGGMGDVYRATQVNMGREVALKVLRPISGKKGERAVKRFEREMKVSARVRHPNTVEVFDFGLTERGQPYLAMELLDGRPLPEVSSGQPISPERTAHIGAQIARALAAAHAEGVVHRDLKPGNVLVLDMYEHHDFVKVLDFGVARFSKPANEEEAAALTSTGMLVGTPLYLAPEYIQHNQLDHRSDLYSLGVVLYELCTGRPPFKGPPAKILSWTVHKKPARPSEVLDAPPPAWLEHVILSLLAKDPEDRPQSAEAVADLLERPAIPAEPPAPNVPDSRGLPTAWLVVGGAVLVGALTVAAFLGFAVAWVLLNADLLG